MSQGSERLCSDVCFSFLLWPFTFQLAFQFGVTSFQLTMSTLLGPLMSVSELNL